MKNETMHIFGQELIYRPFHIDMIGREPYEQKQWFLKLDDEFSVSICECSFRGSIKYEMAMMYNDCVTYDIHPDIFGDDVKSDLNYEDVCVYLDVIKKRHEARAAIKRVTEIQTPSIDKILDSFQRRFFTYTRKLSRQEWHEFLSNYGFVSDYNIMQIAYLKPKLEDYTVFRIKFFDKLLENDVMLAINDYQIKFEKSTQYNQELTRYWRQYLYSKFGDRYMRKIKHWESEINNG